MSTLCAQLATEMLNRNNDEKRYKARQQLEEICMRFLPFKFMHLCRVMNEIELYRICDEAHAGART
jgi:hypothetical protein